MAVTQTSAKVCSICKETKPLGAFTVRSKNRDGHTSRCRACVNAANKRRYMNRPRHYRERLREFNKKLKDDKAEKVFNYLRDHPCLDCGESDPVVLEFDHRELSTKRLAIAQMIERRYSWQTILVEIGKCDVRCANCHRRKTSKQFGHRRSRLQNRAAENVKDSG
ncbi:MAG TPA: hypothetical protein VJ866_15910 [Pyrinomonadaceae bacterium]|nr:hypothetical protein [Pyrinomonadaceae bacterium]